MIHDGEALFQEIDILTLIEEDPVDDEDFEEYRLPLDLQFQSATLLLHHCSSVSIPEIVYIQSDLELSEDIAT